MQSPTRRRPGRSPRIPLASVVIPAFQAEGFLRSAIESALAQTCRDVEVIVVDDGSSDATWDVALACADRDRRVVPLRQPRQMGPSAARNTAISHAKGEWIAVLDADDLFLAERLERLIGQAETSGADFVADTLLKVEYGTGRHLGYCSPSLNGDEQRQPFTLLDAVRADMPDRSPDSKFGLQQPIMRRRFLSEHGIRYDERLKVGEDFLLYFEAIACGGRFIRLPDAYYVYRVRQSSISSGSSGALHMSAANHRMLAIAEEAGNPELMALLLQRQRLIDFDSFAFLTGQGRFAEALRYVHWSNAGLLVRQARVAAGAARRQLLARLRRQDRGLQQAPRPTDAERPVDGVAGKLNQDPPNSRRAA